MKKDGVDAFLEEATRAIDEEKVVFVGNDPQGRTIVTLGGNDFDGQDAANLQSEAKMILSSQMWPILYETMRKTATVYMFTQMKTVEDAQYGKAVLFSIDVMKKVLERVANKRLSTPQKVDKKI